MRRLLFLLTLALLLTACASVRNVPVTTDPTQSTLPLIGISCGGSETMTTLKTTYSDAVRLAGGLPVLIPVTRDSLTVEALVRKLDAVILSGGEDIDPAYFGEEHLPELGTVNAPRDTFDVLLIRVALRQGKPLLGICRGEQVINVVLGGTLYQDIPSQIPSSKLKHRQSEPSTVATQTISIEPGSRLAGILGGTEIGVNSHHHQAVKDLAPGLVVTARATDGVVEAYESLPGWIYVEAGDKGALKQGPSGQDAAEQGSRILATQFHPEAFTQAGDPTFLRIFQDLVARATQLYH